MGHDPFHNSTFYTLIASLLCCGAACVAPCCGVLEPCEDCPFSAELALAVLLWSSLCSTLVLTDLCQTGSRAVTLTVCCCKLHDVDVLRFFCDERTPRRRQDQSFARYQTWQSEDIYPASLYTD